MVCSKSNTGASEHGQREAWEGVRITWATHSVGLRHPSHMRPSEGVIIVACIVIY
jgi:hypothetical protein